MDSPQSPPTSVGEVDDVTPFKLFVGQVPLAMTAEQLRPTFEPYGNIEEVSIIHDKVTQASRGCGFVTFSTEEAARTAIEAVNEKIVLNGKPLVVKFAEGLRQRMEHRLYVANIPPETSEEDLGALFGEHGEVKQIQLNRYQDGTFKGTALIRYARRAEADAATTQLNNTQTLPGAVRPLAVKFAEPRSQEGSPTPPSVGPPTGYAGSGHASPGSGGTGGYGTPPPPFVPMPHATGGYSGMPSALSGGTYGASGGGAAPPPGQGFKLFVGMIPYSTGEAELHQLFSAYGPLMEVFMMREKDGRSKGCAFVRFYTKEAADRAMMQLNGSLVLPGSSRNLVVKYAEPSEPRNPRSAAMHAAASTGLGLHGGGGPMGFNGLPPHLGGSPHLGAAGGGLVPPTSLSLGATDGSQWMALQAANQGRHPQMMAAQGSCSSMMAAQQMMGLGGMAHGGLHTPMGGLVGMAPMGMPSMVGHHYGAATLDGTMLHPAMASYAGSYSQQGAAASYGTAAQYGAAYAAQQMEAQAQAQAGWADASKAGASYATLADQPLSESDYAHRGAEHANYGASGAYDSPQGQAWERLHVANLPRHFSEADVQHLFSHYGQLVEVHPVKRGESVTKGHYFVTFMHSADGQAAAHQLHQRVLNGTGKPLQVRPSPPRRKHDGSRTSHTFAHADGGADSTRTRPAASLDGPANSVAEGAAEGASPGQVMGPTCS